MDDAMRLLGYVMQFASEFHIDSAITALLIVGITYSAAKKLLNSN